MGKAKNPRYFRPQMTDGEAKKRIRAATIGVCEVEGCDGRAVAYYDSAMWRLCAKHAAQLAARTGGKGK